MEVFRQHIDVDVLATNNDEVAKACILIQYNDLFQKDIEIALCMLRIDPTLYFMFKPNVIVNVEVAKVVVKNMRRTFVYIPVEVQIIPEFIEFVFLERPDYVPFLLVKDLTVAQTVAQIMTPSFIERLMFKVRTKIHPHEVLRRIPVPKRRVYAAHKLRERRSFHELIFESRNNIVSKLPCELKQLVAAHLGLVTSRWWMDILLLIQRQIY
jgi:hypothetical protein